jgi:hypothetical protein
MHSSDEVRYLQFANRTLPMKKHLQYAARLVFSAGFIIAGLSCHQTLAADQCQPPALTGPQAARYVFLDSKFSVRKAPGPSDNNVDFETPDPADGIADDDSRDYFPHGPESFSLEGIDVGSHAWTLSINTGELRYIIVPLDRLGLVRFVTDGQMAKNVDHGFLPSLPVAIDGVLSCASSERTRFAIDLFSRGFQQLREADYRGAARSYYDGLLLDGSNSLGTFYFAEVLRRAAEIYSECGELEDLYHTALDLGLAGSERAKANEILSELHKDPKNRSIRFQCSPPAVLDLK